MRIAQRRDEIERTAKKLLQLLSEADKKVLLLAKRRVDLNIELAMFIHGLLELQAEKYRDK